MRGRSILKESASPSVCAFCAHRFGQTRGPSRVQLRFLQSSRPASKPPTEGASLREDNGSTTSRPPAPNWGRPTAGSGNRLGPRRGQAPSWGGGFGKGGIPSGPLGSLAKPNPNELPATPSEAVPLAQTTISNSLLPHEQRARDLMLENTVKAQARDVNISRGAGPESTRAGRYEPRTEAQKVATAQSALRKLDAREAMERNQQRNGGGFGQAQFTIRRGRHIMGEGETIDRHIWRQGQREEETPRWTQLRRRGDADRPLVEDSIQSREIIFAEGRAQREEHSKLGHYTPLGKMGTFNRNQERDSPTGMSRQGNERVFQFSRGSIGQNGSWNRTEENISLVRKSPYQQERAGNELSSPAFARNPHETLGKIRFNNQTTAHVSPDQAINPHKKANQATSGAAKTTTPAKVAENMIDEEHDQRPSRERKQKKRRGAAAESGPSYDDLPKGKDRDKAKRRQQFAYEEEDNEAELEAARSKAELKKQRKLEKAAKKPVPIMLPEFISVANLAIALRVRLEEFVYKMVELGFEETHHDYILTSENAGLIAMEYNFEPLIDRGESEDLKAMEPVEDPSLLPPRPPVVTIMGHVDHGKTTILDYLRKSSVAATEHGGITQHIGAFSVPMPSGKTITFLDTPGHEAFLSMRQRGANITDIVILVVAADDSVMPQTIEAINHAKAAKVPIIVAINKVDKEDSNIDRVKQDLARHGVDVEDFGGDTQVVCVSGKTGQGMDELEEAAVALTDILDMRADRGGQAEGWVVEASIKSMGKCATVLVRRGTMRPGDFIVAGNTWARIRCLRNEAGVDIEEAGPGTPVEIDGWREQPLAGDEVLQVPDEGKAKSVVDYRLEKEERNRMAEDMEAINEHRKGEQHKKELTRLEEQAKKEGVDFQMPEKKVGGPKEVYFIVKGDVSGSVEAVIDSINALGNKEVQPHILRSGVGQLSEFDIEHATVAKGHLINFNTEISPHITQAAEQAKVNIIDHSIIYRLIDDVKAELSKHLPPLVTQRVLGEAEIAQIFSITIKGRQHKNIAGCKVRNGTISKNAKVRVMRHGENVFDGLLQSLKNVKRDVVEMKKGTECGMAFENWTDFQVGDQVQTYDVKEEKRYL